MFEEVATESIAEARNAYTYEKMMVAIWRRKRLLIMLGRTCWIK